MLRDDDGARSIGCTARVDDVLERFEDGRMNIVVSGEEPFKVLDRFESPEYPAGEVEVIAEGGGRASDEDSAAAAREAFAELAERATGERPEDEQLEDASAYAIAARIELPSETKQELLETRDEDKRMELLASALKAVGGGAGARRGGRRARALERQGRLRQLGSARRRKTTKK